MAKSDVTLGETTGNDTEEVVCETVPSGYEYPDEYRRRDERNNALHASIASFKSDVSTRGILERAQEFYDFVYGKSQTQ